MRHLSLARKTEQSSTETEAVEQEDPLSRSFLCAFEACLDSSKENGVPLSSFSVPKMESRKAIHTSLEDMAQNEVRYLKIGDLEKDNSQKHLLVIRRCQGDESVFTSFCVKVDHEGLESVIVFQEIKGQSLGIESQTSVLYNPRTQVDSEIVRSFRSAEDFRKSKTKGDTETVRALSEISAKASVYPVQDAIAHALTEETDRIKAELRKRGPASAAIHTLARIPSIYRQEREAA